MTAQELYEKGRECLREKELDKALSQFSNAIALDPDYAEAYAFRGQVRALRTQNVSGKKRAIAIQKAIEDIDRAIELGPDLHVGWFFRGRINSIFIGDTEKAFHDLSKAIEIDPEHAESFACRGVENIGSKYFDDAIADFGQAIDLDGSNSGYYWERGTAYLCRGDPDKAIDDYSKGLQLGPDIDTEPLLYRGRGEAYLHLLKFDEAIIDLKEAIRLNPEEDVPHSHIRQLLWQAENSLPPPEAMFGGTKRRGRKREPARPEKKEPAKSGCTSLLTLAVLAFFYFVS